jgi:hypothetical protein
MQKAARAPKPQKLSLAGSHTKSTSTNGPKKNIADVTKKTSSTNSAIKTPEQTAAKAEAEAAKNKTKAADAKNKQEAAADLQKIKETTPTYNSVLTKQTVTPVSVKPSTAVQNTLRVSDIANQTKKFNPMARLEAEHKQKTAALDEQIGKLKSIDPAKMSEAEKTQLADLEKMKAEAPAKLEEEKKIKQAANNAKRNERKTKKTVQSVSNNIFKNQAERQKQNNQLQKTQHEIALEKATENLKEAQSETPEKTKQNTSTGEKIQDVEKTPSADINKLNKLHEENLKKQDAKIAKLQQEYDESVKIKQATGKNSRGMFGKIFQRTKKKQLKKAIQQKARAENDHKTKIKNIEEAQKRNNEIKKHAAEFHAQKIVKSEDLAKEMNDVPKEEMQKESKDPPSKNSKDIKPKANTTKPKADSKAK